MIYEIGSLILLLSSYCILTVYSVYDEFGYNMKKMKIVILKCLLLVFLSFGTKSYAGFGGTTLEFFKKSNKRSYLLSNNFSNSFYIGSYNSESAIRCNLGYDIPVATITRSSGYVFSVGVPAKVHVDFIKNSKRYEANAFLFDLALWLQVDLSKNLAFRLYPIYHHAAYSINKTEDVSVNPSINNAMVFLEMLFTPSKMKGLEILGAGGYFYETDARKYLRGLADLDFFYEIPLKSIVVPVIFLKNQVIYEKGVRYGIDGGLGVEAKSSSLRGLGIFLRLFDKPSAALDYSNSEKGVGAELQFIF